MKAKLMAMFITALMQMLTPELLKKFVDVALDFVENYVEGSKSKVDDAIVLPLCATIRATFNVPDD